MPKRRLELPTFALQERCTTIVLLRRINTYVIITVMVVISGNDPLSSAYETGMHPSTSYHHIETHYPYDTSTRDSGSSERLSGLNNVLQYGIGYSFPRAPI